MRDRSLVNALYNGLAFAYMCKASQKVTSERKLKEATTNNFVEGHMDESAVYDRTW